LRRYFVEEVYEALEAIDGQDWDRLCDELGDVMLQVVFHAQLASEAGLFDIKEVLRRINAKLQRRHPHVFGDVQVRDADEVLDNWEHIKRTESKHEDRKSLLDGVSRALPALVRAEEVQRRAARVGFEWPDISGAWEKVREELGELDDARAEGDVHRIAAELGDVLFALVNVARYLQVDAEAALRKATGRFEERFRAIEDEAQEKGCSLTDMTLSEMDELWEAAKKESGETQTQ
jgi:tetrapyrrole methylase family protein/MazG family protein